MAPHPERHTHPGVAHPVVTKAGVVAVRAGPPMVCAARGPPRRRHLCDVCGKTLLGGEQSGPSQPEARRTMASQPQHRPHCCECDCPLVAPSVVAVRRLWPRVAGERQQPRAGGRLPRLCTRRASPAVTASGHRMVQSKWCRVTRGVRCSTWRTRASRTRQGTIARLGLIGWQLLSRQPMAANRGRGRTRRAAGRRQVRRPVQAPGRRRLCPVPGSQA